MHIPYHHKSTIPFLTAIKKRFKIDRVIITGDEVDWHSISFHDKDPDLPFSPAAELLKSIEYLKELYQLYPLADLLESNHGSLVYRKGKHHGIPRSVFKSYKEILEAPSGWNWHNELKIKLPDGKDCLFVHGKAANGLNLATLESTNVVQGHYHSVFEIKYSHNFWSMTVGCMIDDTEMAFAYNKLQIKRPILGCALILNGEPKLLRMNLINGIWDGRIV